jgi:hypothetical protein
MRNDETASGLTLVRDADGQPTAVLVPLALLFHDVTPTPELLEQLALLIEDWEDDLWSLDYTRRAAAGELTDDERATIPLDDLIAELKPGWSDTP